MSLCARVGPHGCRRISSGASWAGRIGGRDAFEFGHEPSHEEIEAAPWAAYSNATSFWLTEPALIAALREVGFANVSKVATPAGYRCIEDCPGDCRVLQVAQAAWKGEEQLLAEASSGWSDRN